MREVGCRGGCAPVPHPALVSDSNSSGYQSFIDFSTSSNVIQDVQSATEDGLGPHAVLLLAVSELPFQQAADYVRPRGCIVAIGLPAKAFLRAPVFSTVVKMISIKGSYVGNRQDGNEAIDFFRRGLIHAPFKVVPLSDLAQVYELMGKYNTTRDASGASRETNNRSANVRGRARQDCRSICAEDAGMILHLFLCTLCDSGLWLWGNGPVTFIIML